MRFEDREMLEEAIRKSGGGEDFDEMLLRATKKHLPRNYHRQFGLMLEEILKEADALGVSNRSAAMSIIKKLAPPPKAPETTDEVIAQLMERSPGPAAPAEPAPKPAPEGPGPEPAADAGIKEAPPEGSVEKLPEEQKILDLGGSSPDSLSPEIQDKLRKLVKAQKRKQAWEEGAPEPEPEPGLFFKGQQRAPPFVPLSRPAKKEETKAEPSEKPAKGGEEEDLEEE